MNGVGHFLRAAKRIALLTLLLAAFLLFGCGKDSTDPNSGDNPATEYTHAEDITQDVTWKADLPNVVEGTISISGAILTIEPGAVIKMGEDARLIINNNGGIIADGTTAPITFTGLTAQKGFWDKLEFRAGSSDANCRLINCVIEYGGGSDGIITLNESNPTIENCVIRSSKTFGMYWDASSRPTFENNVVTGCDGAPLLVSFNNAACIGAGTYVGNSRNYISVDEGSIASDMTWLNHDVPYRLLASSNTIENGTLTIEPGTTIQMDADSRIIVDTNGGLIADGTTEAITFTGVQAQQGFWDCLEFRDGSSDANCKLLNCIIEYGGKEYGYIIGTWGSALTIRNCTIRNSSGAGVYFDSESTPVFEGNTVTGCAESPIALYFGNASYIGAGSYTGNGRDFIAVDEGVVSGNKTWLNLDVPYRLLTSSNTVENGTLTIDPGTTIEMDADTRIVVDNNGGLAADGTTDMITFTGVQKQNGFWEYIEIRSGASNDNTYLKNCTVEYGGGDGIETGLVMCVESSPSVINCALQHSAGCGVYEVLPANPTISGNNYLDLGGSEVCHQ